MIETLRNAGYLLVAPVERSLRQKVRHESRLEVKERYERMRRGYKRNRYIVERFIGNVKNVMGSYVNVKDTEVAKAVVVCGIFGYEVGRVMKKNFCLHFFTLTKYRFYPYDR